MVAIATRVMARTNHIAVSHGMATTIDGICVGTDCAKTMTELSRNIRVNKTMSSREKNNVAIRYEEWPLGSWLSRSEGMAGAWHVLANVERWHL